MRFVPALRLLARVEDVRPVILQATQDNEFNVDLAVKICQSLIIIKNAKLKEQQETEALKAKQELARKKQELDH
jgi:hypothetical protein